MDRLIVAAVLAAVAGVHVAVPYLIYKALDRLASRRRPAGSPRPGARF